MKRVAITCAGVVSGFGVGLAPLRDALRNGKTAVAPLKRFETAGFCSQLAAEAPVETNGDRTLGLANLAIDDAIQNTSLKKDRRRALLVGTTKGTLPAVLEGKLDDPFADLAATLAHRLSVAGPVRTIGAACASSTAALGEAFDLLNNDQADEVFVAGVEALHRFVYAGFHALKAISPEPARPFDLERKGLSMGEAAVCLRLESEFRANELGRPVLAWLEGWGLAMDSHDQTAPAPDGRGLLKACRGALAMAGWEAKDVGRYHAHGTATPHNDRMESAVYSQLFDNAPVPLTAAKGAVGHTLGAAGALDTLICAMSLQQRELWPVANLSTVDPALKVAPVRELRSDERETALVATAGFGGVNAALALSVRNLPSKVAIT